MPNDYTDLTDEEVIDLFENTRAIAGPLPVGGYPPEWSDEQARRNLDAYNDLLRRGWKLDPGAGWVAPETS